MLESKGELTSAPGEFFIQEVKDNEIEAPEVISSWEIDFVVGIQGGIGDSASKIGIFACFMRLSVLVKMLLGQAKVNHIDIVLMRVESHHEVRRFDVAVDVAGIMKLFDSFQHLKQHIDGCFPRPSLLQSLLIVGEILAHKLHDDAVRLFWVWIRHEVEYFANVL